MERLFALPLFVPLTAFGGLAMYVPAAHALAFRHHEVARAFFYSGTMVLFVTGLIALALSGRRFGTASRSQLLQLLLAYTVFPLILALPFVEGVGNTSFASGWFEMVSSFTTTGATLYDAERLGPSLHLWRAMVGWMGGFFVLVTAFAVLAPMNLGGFEVINPGSVGFSGRQGPAGIAVADLAERLYQHIRLLLPVYVGLTAALGLLLSAAGDTTLVAICHAMSTLSTSGISPLPAGTATPSGRWGEAAILLFLLFALSRRTMPLGRAARQSFPLSADPEFRLGVAAVIVVPLVIVAVLIAEAIRRDAVPGLGEVLSALWGAVFTGLSFLTTTGFRSADWFSGPLWQGITAPGLFLVALCLVGGGVATTAGGVKILRIYALYLHGQREMERILHPHSLGGGGPFKRHLRRDGAFVAWLFFMLVALSLAGMVLMLTLTGLGLEESIIFSIASITTTGPLLGTSAQAPLSVAAVDGWARLVMAGGMVAGRMEILALIALVAPGTWRQ